MILAVAAPVATALYMNMKKYILIFGLFLLVAACRQQDAAPVPSTWEEMVAAGSNTTVHLMMWQGDPFINSYIQQFVKPRVKELYNIDLQVAGGQGNQIVSLLMTEKEAGKRSSAIDMMWINGETFYQLRQIDGLYGPFTDRLPNAALVDWNNPFIGIDFQQPIEGYECPWGNVQMAIIYDSLLTPQPPLTMEALQQYVQENPGTFTIPNDFTGITLLKAWLIALAGGGDALDGPFSEERYRKASALLWEYVRSLQPYMWKGGKTFPDGPATMHKLLANGEIHFSMSNNDGEVDNKVLQQLLPPTARAFVFSSGTIQNAHYMGIAQGAPNKAGAMLVINFLLSPEAQYHKLQPAVWGDGTVLDRNRLPEEWQEKFNNVPGRTYAPQRSAIDSLALMELAPEYMIRLFDDFRKEIIEK